ncbi:hypothetical protein E6Q11_06100 [Candidatus Dojkabacteria bacterium]|uniref:Uncharacterized protein n=1 Tax=Candidatus Dojkabacteria bacterium TaxID=2099670 RepID=A0A5C7J3E4_9BACT|nr:MAG: hypothetical protein E6Q11_06100 [Candidatus Dojkabacteria bacterium]
MLSVINGNGRSVPDPLHFSHLIEDACDIEAHLAEPERIEHLVAELSPIERGVIAARLLRDGIDEDTVISLMSTVKEDA